MCSIILYYMIVIVPSLHACLSKQRWYSTAQYHLLYIRANGIGHLHLVRADDGTRWYSTIFGKVGLPVRPSSMVPHCHLHLTLGPSRRPHLLAFNSLPFLVSAHCCLFLVSRLYAAHCCRLFSHCCRFFLAPPITRPRPKKDFRGGDKQLGVEVH